VEETNVQKKVEEKKVSCGDENIENLGFHKSGWGGGGTPKEDSQTYRPTDSPWKRREKITPVAAGSRCGCSGVRTKRQPDAKPCDEDKKICGNKLRQNCNENGSGLIAGIARVESDPH